MNGTNEAGPVRSAIFADLESLATDGRRVIDVDLGCIIKAIEAESEPVLRNAYADWGRFASLRGPFLEAGFLEVQASGANADKAALDLQLAIDALEAVIEQPEIATVYLVTGDDMFTSLARALQRRGKRVVGIGWAQKAGSVFRQTCDGFIEYEAIAPDELRDMILRSTRGRDGARRPTGRRGGAPSGGQALSMDDPRDAGEAQSSGEGGFNAQSSGPDAPAARYELDHADPIIGLLVARNGPGYHPPGNRFVAAMTRIEPSFTLEDYGFENVTGFVNAHPMLSRQPERGRHFEIHLPRKVSLKTVMAGRAFCTVDDMMKVLTAAPIGFLGVTQQTDVLETLHATALANTEPFTRNALVDSVADKLDGFTRQQVAAVERLLWENKLYESVDRSAEVAEEWSVRLKPTVSDIDDLMYLHDRELVFQAMLQGCFLPPEGWSMLFYGDDTSGDEFLEMLASLGFEVDVDAKTAPEVKAPEVKVPEDSVPEDKAPEVKAPEAKQPDAKPAKAKAKAKPKAKPKPKAKAKVTEPEPEVAPEAEAEPEPESASEPEPAPEPKAEEKPAQSFETVVTEPAGPKKGGWWNKG